MTARTLTRKADVEPRPLLELLGLRPPEDRPEKNDFEYEVHLAWEQFKREHPLGLHQDELRYIDLDVQGDMFEKLARKLYATGKFIDYLNAHYGEDHHSSFAWKGEEPDFKELGTLMWQKFQDFRLFWLLKHMTPGEVALALHNRRYSGAIDEDIYKHPHFIYAHKLALSAWHWLSAGPKDENGKVAWERVVQFHRFFMDFTFAEGFDVTIDHSHHWVNKRGPGEYTGFTKDPVTGASVDGTWLDGEFGLLISQNGKHLLTLGVCTTGAGILVNQIQLKQKRGNRWLYKLPMPHFDFALERLMLAAEAAGLPLYLVTGESHAEELGRVHKEAIAADDTLAPRIIRIYNQSVKTLKRVGKKLSVRNYVYHRIAWRKAVAKRRSSGE